MKNTIALILISLSFSLSTHAQATEELQENPFEKGRVNYFKNTIVVFDEYLDTETGSCNTTNLRLILPIGNKDWNLRADLPMVTKNIDGTTTSGLGDFSFGGAYIPYINKKRALAIRVRIITNSANDPVLGSGKWILVPALFYGQFIGAKKNYLWLSTVENLSSFAGQSDRNAVNIAVYENLLLRYFGKNWVGADVTMRYNSTAKGFQNNAFVEYGRKLSPSNFVYVHPTVAFGGEKAYNYGAEAGLLLLF